MIQVTSFFVLFFLVGGYAQNGIFQIDISQVSHEISPNLFGIFFEEINHAGVGGIYAEQIQNRAFGAVQNVVNTTGLVSIEAYTQESFYIRHCNYLGYLSHVSASIDKEDSSFHKSQGLIGKAGYVSFESFNFPGRYLRHKDFRLRLDANDGSQQFAEDSSFLPVPSPLNKNYISLEAYNYPNHYIFWNSSDDQQCMEPKMNLYLVSLDSSSGSNFANATFSFEAPNYNVLSPWSLVTSNAVEADIGITTDFPLNNENNRSLALSIQSNANGLVGISNPGYWGIRVQDGETFYLSFFARSNGTFDGSFIALLQSQDGSEVYAKSVMSVHLSEEWTKFETTLDALVPQGEDSGAVFNLLTDADGVTLFFDVVSLFPSDTYLERRNGLRADLLNMVTDLTPSFVRFPGGCYVEGDKLADAFLWKKSIGPIEERPGHYDLWGYWSDDGLGYFEYLQMCEDIDSEPLYVINIGISHTDYIPMEDLGSWIQDALDAIEFANGPADSTWGSVRAKYYNRTQPFNLRMMALGNEDGGFSYYVDHYTAFAKAIRAVYPDIQLIANSYIPGLDNVDYWDYHVYSSPEWFLNNVHVFDKQNRTGPKVFASEYAVVNDGIGNLGASVAEAAWMTGLIRNSDIVGMASYAPLFVNVNDRFWNPDAIQFNSSAIAATPSYYVQRMFSSNRGNLLVNSNLIPKGNITWTEAIATFDNVTNDLIIILVNYPNEARTINIQTKGVTGVSSTASVITLSGSPNDENTLDDPYNVIPVDSVIDGFSTDYIFTASPCSVTKIIVQVYL